LSSAQWTFPNLLHQCKLNGLKHIMQPPIIDSLLDTDLYKFTMMQCVLHHFPEAQVEYAFKCRNAHADLTPHIPEIEREIQQLAQLTLNQAELDFLATLPYIKQNFIDFLRIFRFQPHWVHIKPQSNDLDISIKGPWLHTILLEIPVLAIINEVYFRHLDTTPNYQEGEQRLLQKIALFNDKTKYQHFRFTDFGTRRRFSKHWQQRVIETLQQTAPHHLQGTSNVDLAHRLKLTPIGTMAHEYLQACQVLGPQLIDSQKFALQVWAEEFRGQLAIALTDVIGIDAFLRDFDLYFAKLYDGLRHDSGDPIAWGHKVIEHLETLNIDPKTKVLIWSDSLNFPKALEIYDNFKDKCIPGFGIGTNLTNDLGYPPIDIVIKMVRCNNLPVAKISDSPGKSMCQDNDYLNYLAKIFNVVYRW